MTQLLGAAVALVFVGFLIATYFYLCLLAAGQCSYEETPWFLKWMWRD
jgi:hypothetical protein